MEVLEVVFSLILIFVALISINLLIGGFARFLILESNYNSLKSKQRVLVEFEHFKYLVKKLCDLYKLSIEKFEVVYMDNKEAIIKIRKRYFKWDGQNLIFIFCENCLIENKIFDFIDKERQIYVE